MSLPLPALITLNADGTWSRSDILPPPPAPPLFGVNDATAFSWAALAYGFGDVNARGQNQLFPSGPGARIPLTLPTADDLWREYFRYFLHYTGLKALRVWISDGNWPGNPGLGLWHANPGLFFNVWDSMNTFALKAGVSLIPILGTSPPFPQTDIPFVQALLSHDGPAVAVWDLWNEPNVAITDPATLQRWGESYIQAVKPYTKRPVMIGTGDFRDFPSADWTSCHTYDSNEAQAFLDAQAIARKPKPHLEGEVGLWANNTYGYWPWYMTNATGWSRCAMVLTGNGRGAFADYPYTGPLPAYP